MFLSDYPRSLVNCFWFWRFPVFDALTVAPALPIALLLARHRFPVSLLCLPPRPFPRFLPAAIPAIALACLLRAKEMLAAFQQTTPEPRPPGPVLPAAGRLILTLACRTLRRAHGRSRLPEALALEGNAVPSGAEPTESDAATSLGRSRFMDLAGFDHRGVSML